MRARKRPSQPSRRLRLGPFGGPGLAPSIFTWRTPLQPAILYGHAVMALVETLDPLAAKCARWAQDHAAAPDSAPISSAMAISGSHLSSSLPLSRSGFCGLALLSVVFQATNRYSL